MEGLQLAIKSAKLTETACREKNAPWPPARSGRQSRADSKSMTAGELQCRDPMKVRTELGREKSDAEKATHENNISNPAAQGTTEGRPPKRGALSVVTAEIRLWYLCGQMEKVIFAQFPRIE